MKTFLIAVLSLLALLESCNARGAPWTEEEFKIIAEKVWWIISSKSPKAEFSKIYPDYKAPGGGFSPNSRKVVYKRM